MTHAAQEYVHDYLCGPVTERFHADRRSRVKLLIGPFGTGKTSAGAYDQIYCQSHRVRPAKDGKKHSRFAIIRNTYPQLRDTTIRTVLDWFPVDVYGAVKGASGQVDVTRSYNQTEKRYSLTVFVDGEVREIELLFRALDVEKDVRNLLSLELTGAWVDEAREINQSIVKGLLGRVGRYPSMKDMGGQNPFLEPPQVILSTNFPSREHWLYKDFVETPIEGYSIYCQTQEENKHNLREGYYEDLEKDYADRPDLLKTLVRGEWGVTVRGKAVYPEWIPGFHTAAEPLLPVVVEGVKIGKNRIIRGWDNTGLWPACALTYMTASGQWLVFKEFCGENIGIIDFGYMVTAWCAENLPSSTVYRDIGDPAAKARDSNKMSPNDYMRRHCHIHIEDGIQTFKIRREAVVNALNRQIAGKPALLVDASCIRLIDGFEGGYAFGEIGNTGIFKPEPEKNEYSHIHDAVQYAATRLFPVRREIRHEETMPTYYGEP